MDNSSIIDLRTGGHTVLMSTLPSSLLLLSTKTSYSNPLYLALFVEKTLLNDESPSGEAPPANTMHATANPAVATIPISRLLTTVLSKPTTL